MIKQPSIIQKQQTPYDALKDGFLLDERKDYTAPKITLLNGPTIEGGITTNFAEATNGGLIVSGS